MGSGRACMPEITGPTLSLDPCCYSYRESPSHISYPKFFYPRQKHGDHLFYILPGNIYFLSTFKCCYLFQTLAVQGR